MEKTRVVHILIGEDVWELIEPAIASAGNGDGLAVVLSGARADVKQAFGGLSRGTILDVPIRSSVQSELRSLRRGRATIDVDDLAPRLKSVQLPYTVVNATSVLSVADARDDVRARPGLVIGMWARMASPRLRLGARLTGARDGLTAEIALARPPDVVWCIDYLWKGGPLVVVSSTDLIAAEVVALSIRDLRTSRAAQLGGPWEDELIQRATEVDLGVPGPEWISVAPEFSDRLSSEQRQRAVEAIELAVARAGISSVSAL